MTVVDQPVDAAIRPLRRVEYDALIEQGFLVGEPIELVEGQLVTMSPQGSEHQRVIVTLSRRLFDAIPEDEGEISVQGPIAADELSEPEPDLAVFPPGALTATEKATTATLVIEVAVSSRAWDLGVKARLYARTGIPDYWVVDLERRDIVVHREPTSDGYRTITRHATGVVVALRHPAVQIDVAGVLRSGDR